MAARNSYAVSNAQVRASLAGNIAGTEPLPPGLTSENPLFFLLGGTPVHDIQARLTRRLHVHDTNDATSFYVLVDTTLDGRMHDPKGRKARTTIMLKSKFRITPATGEVKHVYSDRSVFAANKYLVSSLQDASQSTVAAGCEVDLVGSLHQGLVSLWDAMTTAAKRSVDGMEKNLADRATTIGTALARGEEKRAAGYLREQEQAQERAVWAAEDLAVLSGLRDTRLGVATMDAQRAAQRAARLHEERSLLASEHQSAVAAARERQAAAQEQSYARIAHGQALAAQSHEMYAVIRALQAGSLPVGEEMQARLDAIVTAVEPTDPD